MSDFAQNLPSSELPTPSWQNSFLHRLMLASLINQMENHLLAESSATQTLERWLRDHKLLGKQETLRAEREPDAQRICPPDMAAALDLPTPHTALNYRKIRLVNQGRTYSEAENWFVPQRLTKTMTEALEQTDTPFGRVVSPLRFTRQLIRRETLWSPLPELWEMQPYCQNQEQAEELLALPAHLFRHIALLRTHEGTPFSLVVETYTPQSFAFAPPAAP
ncbi:hypothetical protein [Acetobacter ghanensis]|uniref:Chorismate lyase n=1 Tax=Acetobacter ghanensis TaxID=431306 RepID=A0A0U5F5H5_9PROT|nr:hypothetical protein [Acetobacter ghanensis]NHO39002.1 hypothetical protein [Acetobacter ghanensis]CEF57013.1 hypothetical protein AGA_2322 [Acetobacter ghanensis]